MPLPLSRLAARTVTAALGVISLTLAATPALAQSTWDKGRPRPTPHPVSSSIPAGATATAGRGAVLPTPPSASAAVPGGPAAKYGAKGNPTLAASPLASQVATPAAGSTQFMYAGARQQFTTGVDGTVVSATVHQPKVATGDAHSLFELAVESVDGHQIVEIGWNVDPSLNGDSAPHLFVYHWVDGGTSCYNACGFVSTTTAVVPGKALTSALQSNRVFGIQHHEGNWWLYYDGTWLGYYPDSLWKGTFTSARLVQWFGEVAAASTNSCTAMGSGALASAGNAASATVDLINGPSVALTTFQVAGRYTTQAVAGNAFRYGGPGAC